MVNLTVCPCLQSSLTHNRNINPLENKVCEIFIFIKKRVCSFIEPRKSSLIMFLVGSMRLYNTFHNVCIWSRTCLCCISFLILFCWLNLLINFSYKNICSLLNSCYLSLTFHVFCVYVMCVLFNRLIWKGLNHPPLSFLLFPFFFFKFSVYDLFESSRVSINLVISETRSFLT